MPSPIAPTDEYILAAFLSGQLPDPLRKEIMTYLTRSGQARDILAMARDAMDSLEAGDGKAAPAPVVVPAGDGRPAAVVPPAETLLKRLDERTVWRVTAVFAGAVLVLALIVMALVLDPSRPGPESTDWTPQVGGEALELTWPAVPGATSYQLLLFDAETHQARVLGASEQPRVDLEAFTRASSGLLSILALDDAGRVVGRSTPLDVRVP